MPKSGRRGKQDQRAETNWLQVVTQVVALFAGVATIVYLAGAVVLSLRLAYAGLPFGNVVSQLPRQFLISIGAGQVLFPALLLGALYGLVRLLRLSDTGPPKLSRWRDGRSQRCAVLWAYTQTFLTMILPLAVIVALRLLGGSDFGEDWYWWFAAALVVLLLAAMAAHEARAAFVHHYGRRHRWNGLRGAATMAGLYCVAAIPATMVGAAALPLSHAKVCDADNFAEHGYLVGETSDRVYLGEEAAGNPRRIAVIPFSRVEELFVGADAKGARCEVASSPLSPQERKVRELKEEAEREEREAEEEKEREELEAGPGGGSP